MLDLFAGTGALGIEALSRGAKRAVFVERDGRALRGWRAIWRLLGSRRARPRCGAERRSARCGVHEKRAETYDLVLIDPPYRRASDLGREMSLALAPLLAPKARVVVESDRRAPLSCRGRS